MKEQRLSKRFSAKLPVRLEAIASSRITVLYLKTKDISATGAFFYTKGASFIPDDTRFTLNSSDLNNIRIKLKKLKKLYRHYGALNFRRYSDSFKQSSRTICLNGGRSIS